jgi:hypothetical protein
MRFGFIGGLDERCLRLELPFHERDSRCPPFDLPSVFESACSAVPVRWLVVLDDHPILRMAVAATVATIGS